MRFRLALALSLSLLLIGVATWDRFAAPYEYKAPSVVAIEQFGINGDSYEAVVQDFTEPKSEEVTPPSTEPLSNTDIVGRQMIMDYITIAAGGQATEANLTNLANQYVSSLPALLTFHKISYADLKTVSNAKENLRSYADAFDQIYIEHSTRINNVLAGSNIVVSPENYYALIGKSSSMYEDLSLELKNLPVPLLLASTHAELVNIELSSAAATKAVLKMEEDPATGFAGLIHIGANLDHEISLLKEIEQILKANGV